MSYQKPLVEESLKRDFQDDSFDESLERIDKHLHFKQELTYYAEKGEEKVFQLYFNYSGNKILKSPKFGVTIP